MQTEQLIRVGMVNLAPDDARTPIKPIIAIWEQIESFFSNYKISARAHDILKLAEYVVDLDASQVINDLHIIDEYDSTTTDREYLLKKIYLTDVEKCGLTLNFRLTAANQAAIDCPHTPRRLVNMLLQQIFVAANLCLPASCKLYKITYPDSKYLSPPSMDCFYFESCTHFARNEGWPKYKTLPFSGAWKWLIACGVHDLDIAKTSVQRAIFSLFELARFDEFNLAEVLFIAQALEGLLVKNGEPIQQTLTKRIKTIVGAPARHQNWVKDFYGLRSTIAHGSYPMVRVRTSHEESPAVSKYHDGHFLPLVLAVAALLAILQDMILEGISEYRFVQHETMSRVRIDEEGNV